MALPQGISRSGFFSPAESTDGILHSITLKGGYQEMLTTADRNNIESFLNITGAVYDGFTQSQDVWSSGRRRVGMMVYVIEERKLYNLIPVGFFGNGGDLGEAEWLALPEWERALRIDPSGSFTSESASPLNGFTAVLKTAANLGLPADPNSCWVELSIEGPAGIAGSPGTDGLNSYIHIAYANSADGLDFSKTESNDKTFLGQYVDNNPVGSDDFTRYTWTSIKGEKGDKGADGLDGLQGADGADGVPGPKGLDGISTYFHIAYADDASGGGFSQSPEGKLYIGTYVDTISTDAGSTSSLWRWQLVKGADGENGENGIPGENGTNGQTSYLHLAYANDSNGLTGFSVTDSDNKLYIGQYTDFTLEDSLDPNVYMWTRIKGDKGDKGDQGLTGLQGPDGAAGVPGPKGLDGVSSYFHIAYADTATGAGFSQSPEGKLYIGTYVDTISTDAGSTSSLWRWQLVKGADGENGENGIPGTDGTNGQTSYLHIAYANNTSGLDFSVSESAGRDYIGQYTDYVLADSNQWQSYKWSLIKGDQGAAGSDGTSGSSGVDGAQGLQGLQGADGAQGIPGTNGARGADGVSSYFHIAYADTATGSGFSQSPVGKDYIGTYVDYSINDALAGDTKWKWALVKGADGANGIPGANGTNGQTSYLHIAYATNSIGTTGFSTTVATGKTYIGQYTDFILADSTDPSRYSWTLIKGETGPQGAAGSSGTNGTSGTTPNMDNYITTSTNIDGGKITTGILKSGDFNLAGANWSTYSPNGMAINLDNNTINAQTFYIDTLGNAKFKGDIDIAGNAQIGGVVASSFFRTKLVDGLTKLALYDDVIIGETTFSQYKQDARTELQEPSNEDPTFNTTLSHMYVKRNDVSIESGDLVKLDGNNELVKADSAKDTGIVGILWRVADYSLKPSLLDKHFSEPRVYVELDHHYRDSFGVKLAEADRDTKSLWKVASLGDSTEDNTLLGMKVCNQNGPVVKGDLLCSSDTPGYLMKQPVEYAVVNITDGTPQYEERQVINSFTVAKCMSSVNFDENGKAEGVYGYLYCG